MKYRIFTVLALLIILLVCGGIPPCHAQISLISPEPASYVEGGMINLVISLDGPAADQVRVNTGKKSYDKLVNKKSSATQVCLSVELEYGENRVKIEALSNKKVISSHTLSIYRRSALLPAFQNVPDGYRRHLFHTAEKESKCSGCHKMEMQLSDINPSRPEDSPCHTCHKQIGKSAINHRPVASGGCFSCHEVTKGGKKYSTKKPDQQRCFVCHSSNERNWKQMKFHHGPTAVGNCTVCHNPHGSDWYSLTHLHPTELCLNCHNDKKTGAHVIAGFFAKGHPVKAPAHPLKKERPFTCAGCHNPHAGDNQSLLNQSRSSLTGYCQNCHKL